MLRIALWGCGGMGRSLAQALIATGQAKLAATYDVRQDAAASAAADYGAEAMPSAEALLAYPGLHGVIVAVPPYLHAPAAEQAAQAGVPVFLEKPMSVDVAGCRRILAATRKHGIPLMVGQVLRYYEPYRSILRWHAEGRWGRIYAASIWRISNGHQIDPAHWRASNALSGGVLLEVGAHELDMLRCLFGRPETVYALCRKVFEGREWADYIAAQIRFRTGGAAAYESGVGSYAGRYGFRFYFEQATLLSDAAFDRAALQVHGADGEKIDVSAEFSVEHPVQAELRGWLAALRGEASIPIPGEEGLATVALAEAAYRSAERGAIVQYKDVLGN